MSKRNKSNREQLLLLAESDSDKVLEFEGYLSYTPNSTWYTFTQVFIPELDLKLKAHINLPKYKVDKVLDITIQDNHKIFRFTGTPSYYTTKGTKRGTVQLITIQRK